MSLFFRNLPQLEGEARAGTLKRVLGPVNLTTLGVGSEVEMSVAS